MNRRRDLRVVLAFILLSLTISGISASPVIIDGAVATNDNEQKVLKTPNNPYYIGSYLYTSRFEVAAKEQKKELFELLDEYLKELADIGVNVIHITIPDASKFNQYIKLADKYNIKLLVELDFAYFRRHWSDIQMKEYACKAIDFLKLWHKTPQVLAWSIKEEPNHADIAALDTYYRMIIAGVPDVKFFLVASGGGWLTANAADLPFTLVGGDYYYFSWHQGQAEKAYTREPRLALSESRYTTELFHRASQKFGVDRIHVFAAAACTIPSRAQGFATGSSLPKSWSQAQIDAYCQKIQKLADNGLDGWNVYHNVPGKKDPQYNMWTLYMPPENCIRALTWGGIMEGAKVTMCFMYNPYSKYYYRDSPLDAIITGNYLTECFAGDLGRRPDKKINSYFNEFSETVREVRHFDHILPQLSVLSTSPLENYKGADRLDSSFPATSLSKNWTASGLLGDEIFARAFKIPGLKGQVLIVHNANVGHILCPQCKAKSLTSCKHIFIDEHGGLKHYYAQKKDSLAKLTLIKSFKNSGIFDIATGKLLHKHGQSFVINIAPGGAKVLYAGNSTDAGIIHQLYKK